MSSAPGYATIDDAIAGMKFVRAAKRSSEAGATWVELSSI
jgi:hypothetical protein